MSEPNDDALGRRRPSTDVESSDRGRILMALEAAIAERGYGSATIADIARHAHTSRRTIYREFTDKQQCYLHLLQYRTAGMFRQIRQSVDPRLSWQDQVRQAAGGFVSHVASHPSTTLSWIRDLPAVGMVGVQLRGRDMGEMHRLINTLADEAQFGHAGIAPLPRAEGIVLLGGIGELTATALERRIDPRVTQDAIVSATVALLSQPRPQSRVATHHRDANIW